MHIEFSLPVIRSWPNKLLINIGGSLNMKNIVSGAGAIVLLAFVLGCGCGNNLFGGAQNAAPEPSPANTNPAVSTDKPSSKQTNAFRITGTIDDALQEGDVCDTSVEFTVPGTLRFKFTPKDARSGEYTYSGPFNATGSGPYVIRDDGTMLVDGTGCIMGKCATYSHEWKAKQIDRVSCGK